MEVRGRSRRNRRRVTARRQIRAWISMVLTAAMIIGNMAASVNTVLAAEPAAKEEFRIRAKDIQKAAEKALDEENVVTEEILLEGNDRDVVKEYQEMLEADGRLYELDILDHLETVKDVDGVTLRVFMRLPKEADPKTHVLNGEEELYFLYVNDGEESVTARLNIEGLISGFSTIRPYEAAFGDAKEDTEDRVSEPSDSESTENVENTENNAGESNAGNTGSNAGGGNSGQTSEAAGQDEESKEESADAEDNEVNKDTEEKTEESASEQTREETETPEEKPSKENPTESAAVSEEDKEAEEDSNSKEEDKEDNSEAGSDREDNGQTDGSKGNDSGENNNDNDDEVNDKEENNSQTDDSKGSGSEGSSNQTDDSKGSSSEGSSNQTDDSKGSSSEENSSQTDDNKGSSSQENSSQTDDSKGSSSQTSDSKGSGSEDKSGSDKAESDKSGSDTSSSDKNTSDSSSKTENSGEKADSSSSGSSSKEDSKSEDSSAKEVSINTLKISLHQVLRVAEPEDSAADETETSETEPVIEETETEEETEEETTEEETTEEETEEEIEEPTEETDESEREEETTAEETAASETEEVPTAEVESEEETTETELEEDTWTSEPANETEETDVFKQRGMLEGKLLNLVAFENGLTARAFVTTLEKLGMNKEDLIEGGHILTYTISPVGSAVIVNGPELVRDEAKVSFGVVPQTGYEIVGVTANGVNLEEVSGENVASSSDARLASASETGEDAVYYVIPSVLEDQEVEIILAEETEEDIIKAGSLTAVADGYTVRVDFGIEAEIPEGAELEVTPVSDTALDYIRYELLNLEEPGTEDQEYALDIKIIADGQEIQPSAPVLVTIGLADSEEVSDASVYHFPGTSAESIESAAREESAVSIFAMARVASVPTELPAGEELEATADEEGIRFYTEGFSVYLARAAAKPGGTTLADTDPDPNFIRVEKTFTGITEEQIPDNFTVTVKENAGGQEYTLDKNSTNFDFTSQTNADGSIVWCWEITNAEAGTYTVSEKNQTVDGYDVKTDGEGQITVTAAEMKLSEPDHETTCSHVDWPVYDGTFFAATLTDGGVAVITEHSLSASQRITVAEAVKKINGPWKDPVYFYSIDDQIKNGHGFQLNGATITYKEEEQKIYIGAPNNWQHVATINFDISQAQNPEIAITNAYTLKTTSFAIEKLVEGSSVPDGAEVSFKMYRYDGEDVPETPADTDGDGIPDGYSVYNLDNPVITTSDFSNAGTEGFLSSAPEVIEGLVEGYYLIEEVATLSGYQKLEGYIQIRVSVSETDGTLICNVLNEPSSGSRPSWKWSSDSEDGTKRGTLTVYNYTAPRLPDTGGPGIGLIKEFGWVLLLLALMMAGMEVQYYGERRKRIRVDGQKDDVQRYDEL